MHDLNVIHKGKGTPVVWIHGFPLSSIIFEQQVELPDVRHVVPDLPGFGKSAPRDLDSIDEYGSAVLSVLDDMNIDHAVVAGVSMGGYIAFSILRQRPSLVSALVLIDTREGPDSPDARANRYSQIDRVRTEGHRFLVDDMLPRMLTRDTLQLADRRATIVRRAMESASEDGVTSALRAMAGRPDSSSDLRSFNGPVLVVVGSDDDITPPSDATRMAALASDSTLVTIPGAAHLSHVERPEVFNEAMRSFLARVP